MPHFGNVTGCYRRQNSAAWLGVMVAVIEFAVAQMRAEFGESAFQHPLGQMMQAKFLEAGRINNDAVGIEMIRAHKGGGVLAGIQRGGNLTGGDFGIRNEQINERRFSHARLADQNRRLPF